MYKSIGTLVVVLSCVSLMAVLFRPKVFDTVQAAIGRDAVQVYNLFSGAEGDFALLFLAMKGHARGSSKDLTYGEFRCRLHAHPFELTMRN